MSVSFLSKFAIVQAIVFRVLVRQSIFTSNAKSFEPPHCSSRNVKGTRTAWCASTSSRSTLTSVGKNQLSGLGMRFDRPTPACSHSSPHPTSPHGQCGKKHAGFGPVRLVSDAGAGCYLTTFRCGRLRAGSTSSASRIFCSAVSVSCEKIMPCPVSRA